MSKLPLYVVIGIIVAGIAVSCTGWTARDFIPARTPLVVQRGANLPASMPVSLAEEECRIWIEQATATARRWTVEINAKNKLAGFVDGFVASSLEVAGQSLPGGTPLLGLLGLAAGVFVKRPKDKSPAEVQKEKEGSYKKGRDDGIAMAEQLVAIKLPRVDVDVVREKIASAKGKK